MIRKSREEIRTEIIRLTWGMARSPNNLSKELVSNWSTIKEYIDGLVKEKILEEIYIDYKIAGYKISKGIKDIVINSFSPRDFDVGIPEKLVKLSKLKKQNKKEKEK